MIDSSKVADIRAAFQIQAESCRELGSPFTGRLCDLFSQRLKPAGKVADELFNWQGDIGPFGASLPLRLAGALHALVLHGDSQALRDVYLPYHENSDDDVLWNTLETSLFDHDDFILQRLQSPPQTNEVRRASVLLPGFLTIASQTGLPFVLSEIGASAGLNLSWDQFSYRLGDTSWGNENSTVKLACEWMGPPLHMMPVDVLGRAGCDLYPIDPANRSERTRLLSFIWPDQADRLILTKAALDLAAQRQTCIEKADGVNWLKKRLSVSYDNSVHVIYHTIMWQYMSPSDQIASREVITSTGHQASDKAPLAWLRFEADGVEPGASLMLTLWPTGIEKCIARADFHGRWIHWSGW